MKRPTPEEMLATCRLAIAPKRARPTFVHTDKDRKIPERRVPAHLLAWAVRRIEVLEEELRSLKNERDPG